MGDRESRRKRRGWSVTVERKGIKITLNQRGGNPTRELFT